MQIDLEHLHHWMCAIRESDDPLRTLDAFWKGQIDSKLWLIENLKQFVDSPVKIDIHGGWVGVLSSLIFQSDLPVLHITSLDIDSSCEKISKNMNKLEEISGRFSSITADMCFVNTDADIVINTSSEHLTQEQYDRWLENVSSQSLIVVQSNNYNISEHVRIANSLEEFQTQSRLNILWKGEKTFPLYTRYMIIGKKNVFI
jgi:uncharacterized protein (DUF2235 family)